MQVSKFLHIMLLCTCIITSHAQNKQVHQVTGTVTDPAGKALRGVSLKLIPYSGKPKAILSSTEGHYRFDELTVGAYRLEVTSLGYLSQVHDLTVGHTAILQFDIRLYTDQRSLDEVKVTGKSQTQELKESGFAVTAVDTRRFANTTADLNQILSRTTGVRVREQGGLGSDFSFSINGLSGRSVTFFIDGVPLNLLGSAMSLNNIPVNLAERLEVYKGVVPVMLGTDALGGAVNIVTNQQVKNYLDASYSIGSFNTHRAALTAQHVSSGSGVITKLSGFYNYSDNSYMMHDVEIWNEEAYKFVPQSFPRFHDNYRSAMGQFEIGLTPRSWADVLFVGASYSSLHKELQMGNSPESVYGDAHRKGHALNGTLRYVKNNLLLDGLNVNLFASHAIDHYTVVDTAYRQYVWDGSYTNTNGAEIGGGSRSMNTSHRPKDYIRLNANYAITENHGINLNYTLDATKNTTEDNLLAGYKSISSVQESNDRISKHTLGLAYQQELMNRRLSTTYFGKLYGIGLNQEQYYAWGDPYFADEFNSYVGYGIASRYSLTQRIGIKASAEHAYRLPLADEVLGDGFTTLANLSIKPEMSNNYNAGAFFSTSMDQHSLFVEGGWFFRNVHDYIFPEVIIANGDGFTIYRNLSNVDASGLEGEIRYQYADKLFFTGNISYQRSVNTSDPNEITYENRIPNQPWIFGNADIAYQLKDVLGKGNQLQLNWYSQYVHWFFRTWEAFGSRQGKDIIPTQYIHNAVATYSLKEGKYNLSLECKNIFDKLAFDNFRIQKPGRSFAVKIRYFIQ